MRIVFCGTPDFAVPSLHALADAGIDIPLVVSRPDRVRGRRGKPEPSPVRAAALARELPTAVLERGQRSALYDQILGTEPDLVAVVAFGHIVRDPLLHGAPLGCVNVHASLLPRWRGPAPIHTAIVAGDRQSGVCTMKLAEGVDTGDVYRSVRLDIGADETAGELHDRLAEAGASSLLETVLALHSGTQATTPQPEAGATHAPMLDKSEGSVTFDQPPQRVHDRIRGLDPWPGTRVMLDGREARVAASTQPRPDAHDELAGTILEVEDEAMVVACQGGTVRIRSLQLPGKRAVTPAEYQRGHGPLVGRVLGPMPGFKEREPRT